MGEIAVRLLGAVAVEREGAETTRGPLMRTLLALLASTPGAVVPSQVLMDELWGEDLPEDPRRALAIQVTRLRGWLSPDNPRIAPVQHEHGGYRLAIEAGHVDRVRFDAEADAASAKAATSDARLAHVEAALREWRGAPFEGCVVSGRLHGEQVRLAERHLVLVERRAELLIERDEPERALEGLIPVRGADLGRERLTLLTMRAHQRLGQRQEALAVYREYADHLREEFGLSPGRSVREVHAEVLADDPLPARPAVQAPDLVGRLAPLREIRGMAATGGLVIVEAPPGMGKSALLRAALEEARRAGARVGSGTWDHDDDPLSAWREAFGALELPAREALSGAVAHQRLVGLGRQSGVVLGLDDAHRADAASLGVLRAVARRGLPAGAVVVVTARNTHHRSPRWDETLADLACTDGVRRIALGELATEDVLALSGRRLSHLGAGAARRLGEAVARRSAGHPLHAVALLDVLRRQPDEAACWEQVDVVPESLRPLLAGQVDLLPAPCRRPLEALATLRPIALDPLAAVLDTNPIDLLDGVRPALDAGLLVEAARQSDAADRLDFRHDLVAGVVHDAVPIAQQRRWHRAALGELPDDADPFERRRHGVAAGPLLARSELGDLHRRAGHAAYRRGAPQEALACFSDAAPDIPALDEADLELGRGLALTALGRLDEAHDVLDALVVDLDPSEEQARLAAVGDGTLGAQVTGDARRLARLRLVAARPGSPELADRDRLELLLALTVEETVLEGRVTTPNTVVELARLAGGLADDPDPDVAVRARLVLLRALAEAPVPATQRLAAARRAVHGAVGVRDAATRLDAHESLVAALLASGRVEEARETSWWLRREARNAHRPRSVWTASLVDAAIALAAGEVDEADALAARAHGLGVAAGVPDAPGTLQAFTMVRHWQTGTAALLGEVPAAAALTYPHITAWTAAAACADVQAGRFDRASEHLARYRERRASLEARTFDRPGLCLAAAAAFRVQDAETARVVVENLPPDPEAVVVLGIGAAIIGPALVFRALAEAVLDDHPAALDHLEQAAALAGDIGWTPWKETATAVARRIETGAGPALPLGLGPAR